MSRFGAELIRSAEEALAIAEGRVEAKYVIAPEAVDVRAIRRQLDLSQAEFASRFGLSAATLRDWEQGRRIPDRIARLLLKVIEQEPDAVRRAATALVGQRAR